MYKLPEERSVSISKYAEMVRSFCDPVYLLLLPLGGYRDYQAADYPQGHLYAGSVRVDNPVHLFNKPVC
jgi:hypothetical protein